MSKKVISFPITYDERIRNQMGPGYVPCQVSGRWLQFPKNSGWVGDRGEFMFTDIMTAGQNGEPRKICSLLLKKDDILRAVNSVRPSLKW